jgi:hypothetical protein
MLRVRRCAWCVLPFLIVTVLPAQQQEAAGNLARTAKASASEDCGTGFLARFANHGDATTRWSGIPATTAACAINSTGRSR